MGGGGVRFELGFSGDTSLCNNIPIMVVNAHITKQVSNLKCTFSVECTKKNLFLD